MPKPLRKLILLLLCSLLLTGCAKENAPTPAQAAAPATTEGGDGTQGDGTIPAAFLSSITADARRCSAEFPPNAQQQYVFTRNQDAQLIWILNQLKPEEFFVGAALEPQIVVTISHEEHPIRLYWNGEMTQFSFTFDHTRWAVRNEDLNDFFQNLLSYSPENSTYEIYNMAPLNELPETYSQEEAIIDRVVVMNEGDVRDNAAVWEEFLKSANARIPATVRIMKYYSAADNLEAVKNVYDLEFDGDSYHLHYVENGRILSAHYHHLWNLTGQSGPLESGAYQEYALMCLSNEEAAELPINFRENDRFSRPGEDPFMVWCDYTVRQKKLTVPESTKITLEVDLRPIVTVTDPAIIHSIELIFSEAEACFTPQTCFPGPVLRFHSSDGLDLSLQLDLQDDLCIFNDQFYRYGKTDASMLPGLFKLLDLEDWPDEVVNHDAFAWYFDSIRPSRQQS